MKKIHKLSSVILSIALILGTTDPIITFAAATPSLGEATSYGILASTYTNTSAGTTVNGDIGFTTGPAVVPGGVHTNYGSGAPYAAAGTDQGTALSALASELCTFTFGGGAIDLSTDITHGPAGVYTPGVYCSAGAMDIGGPLTLNGSGTYIFRTEGALTSTAGAIVTLSGASACDIFWTPIAATTLAANTTFAGTVISNAGITIGANTTWAGRALAFGGTVTTDTNTITVPTCEATPATLNVVKTVINDNDGTAVASDFNLHVKLSGTDVTGSPAVGTVAPGTSYSLSAGTYVISEDANASYTQSFSGDCDASGNIILASGDDKTCTITNNDIAPVIAAVPATLHIVKTVVNDNGGTAVASNFTIDVDGTNVSTSTFAGSEAGVDVTLDAGVYAVTETSLPGYLQSGSGDCSGTITAGETKTCTITNNDIAPQLIVNKIVVNDNSSTKVISDFSLFIDGSSVTSGIASTTTIGLHTVSETSDSGYTSAIGGDCAVDGTITLALGEVKTCTITNDDIAPPSSGGGGGGSYRAPVPPLIDVVKVPNPLALPDGPGNVEYTYTLRNIGTVAVNNITMVGDTCDPITLISGDTDADNRLDVNETWIYTCSTTLSETHTNIITATGWANGITATDIANATVIVGIPVIPPLIHVTKVPNPLVLSAGGGTVTYTNKVTNPGTVALSNIRLNDDKCGPVEYIFGDTNSDSKLDPNETWTYSCSANLTQTTTNTISASGDANGLTARDFAIVTVVVNVAVPGLPDTGLFSSENNAPWNMIVPAGILIILASFYFVLRKQKA